MKAELFATALPVAEAALNRVLKADPVTLLQLAQLQGKVVAIELVQPSLQLFLLPHPQGIQLQEHSGDTPDVTLSGTAAQFIQLLQADTPSDAMFGKTIQVHGDTALAQRLSQILHELQIDWEAWLAGLMGDLPAHTLSQLLRLKWRAQQSFTSSLSQNSLEYLQEELRLLPARAELDAYSEQITHLRRETERLQARISALDPTNKP